MIQSTKIFLDSGNPQDTQEILEQYKSLDGQTTNPSLVAKHPKAQELLAEKNTSEEKLLDLYKEIIQDMKKQLPQGSISIEVYADNKSTPDELLNQARVMKTWIDKPHIKLPTTPSGLEVARILVDEGVNVNMTLCFTQEQAMAVHMATIGAEPGQVFVSPFVGRLDDKGENGIQLIENILHHYDQVDSHVSVLAASIRSLDHMYELLRMKTHIITAPKHILNEWIQNGAALPETDFVYNKGNLRDIPFTEIDYKADWKSTNLQHELTDSGLEKFASDWKKLFN